MPLNDETRAMLSLLDDYARFRARTCERAAYQSHDVADVDETLRTEAKVWMEIVALMEEAGDTNGPFSMEAVGGQAERWRQYYANILANADGDAAPDGETGGDTPT
jgi:hypothetical protein